ncbi:MAG TPA: SCP2 sterol-binding domain-containing protein [Pseudonocardiaceae bacterium]|nr:SCP2 sterol-binding domain-containing protein [Pseudonocardiaceae bacterium]
MIARALDPRKMGPRGLAQLIETLDLLAKADTGIALDGVDTITLVTLIARASDEQIAEVASSPKAREMVLGEVFRRMSQHLRADKLATGNGVVRWRIACGAGADYQRFQTVFENGNCVNGTTIDRDPKVTLTLSIADFLRLVASCVGFPRLVATRRLKFKGDIRYAIRLSGMFDIPKPRSR